jgi:hypothetical protein
LVALRINKNFISIVIKIKRKIYVDSFFIKSLSEIMRLASAAGEQMPQPDTGGCAAA